MSRFAYRESAASIPALAALILGLACNPPSSASRSPSTREQTHGELEKTRPAENRRAKPILKSDAGMARIPAGEYKPMYSGKNKETWRTRAFRLDKFAVTNRDFARFVAKNPRWLPGKPPKIMADAGYLRHWKGDKPRASLHRLPVVYVSWFAARAYCRAQNKRLPTVAEWERAAGAPDAAHPREGSAALTKRILRWYSRPNAMREIGTVYKNTLGIYDAHGSVWEWTEDFNSTTIVPDGRGGGAAKLFCGGAGYNASNPRDYAAFMRSALRGSLKASSTTANLGFRCARDLK